MYYYVLCLSNQLMINYSKEYSTMAEQGKSSKHVPKTLFGPT